MCPCEGKLGTDNTSDDIRECSRNEGNECDHGRDPVHKDYVDNEDSETAESCSATTYGVEESNCAAEAGGDRLWLRVDRLGVLVECRIGIFSREGFEDDGRLRGFDHNECRDYAAKGVLNLVKSVDIRRT
jgi:hypothetical protein